MFCSKDEDEKLRKKLKLPELGNLPTTKCTKSGGDASTSKVGASTISSSNTQNVVSKERTILDIEAKLKAMEREAVNFNLAGSGSTSGSGTSTSCNKYPYQQNIQANAINSKSN